MGEASAATDSSGAARLGRSVSHGGDVQTAAGIGRVQYLGQIGALAVFYFAAAKLSLLLAIPPGYAAAVWPPSGIALAAVLLFGNRIWPGIWIGATLANLTVEASLFSALLIGTGNTFEALAASALIARCTSASRPLERGEDVIRFVAIAALSATIAATTALIPLASTHAMTAAEVGSNWLTWWQGDASGIIIVTPLILSWSRIDGASWSRRKILELACFSALLLAITHAVFGKGAVDVAPYPLTFVIVPFIVWAALRFGPREVTTAITVVCSIAVWNTLERLGPFALAPLNESLLLLLAFICIVVVTGLLLSAVVGERMRAMNDLHRALQEVQEQAITDPLTTLLNRRYLQEFLPREVIRTRRKGASLAVIMIDLDHFKRVNDTFGHQAGDFVLTEVAALLKGHIRGSDIACRYGGEEFVLVLPDTTLASAQRRAEAIRSAIKRLEPEFHGKRLGNVTASLGVVLFPDHAENADSLLNESDTILYEAKNSGRDRVLTSASVRRTLPEPVGAAVRAGK